jgi:uncharacterized protein (TIGR02145 family)
MRNAIVLAAFLLGMQLQAVAQWQPGEPITDPRDGQTYRTVVIGTQIWMAENLNIGTLIPSTAGGGLMTNNGVIEKYCWTDDVNKCDGTGDIRRGGFYEWNEAMQYWDGQPALPVRGICPEGWHIPSNAEWNTLLNYTGGSAAYRQLIVGGGSGFDALLTGYRCTMTGGYRVSAMSADTRTYFWTAEQTDADNAPLVEIGQNSLQSFSFLKSLGLCVRCIMDSAPTGIGEVPSPSGIELRSLRANTGRMLTVEYLTESPAVEAQVVDMLGRLMYADDQSVRHGVNMLRIDLSGCPAGAYILRLTDGGESVTRLFTLR